MSVTPTPLQAQYATYSARLATTGYVPYEGPIKVRVPTDDDYFVLYDDTMATRSRLVGVSCDLRVTLRTVCASRTRSGARRMADLCRDVFTDWTPAPGVTGPLVEEEAGPILTETAGDDTRHSITLVHRTTTARRPL